MADLQIQVASTPLNPMQRFALWSQRTHRVLGKRLAQAQDNGLLRYLTQTWGGNWLLDLLYRVDTRRIAQEVALLRHKYPTASAKDLSQKLIQAKLLTVGGVGFVAGLAPIGVNIPFLALDVVASLRLQSELVYGIAAAHGLDLEDSQRKGELLWVLALGFGGEKAIFSGVQYVEKTALPLITPWLLEQIARRLSVQIAEKFVTRWLPLVGSVLGAGANMALLTLMGQTAIHFYEQQRVLE